MYPTTFQLCSLLAVTTTITQTPFLPFQVEIKVEDVNDNSPSFFASDSQVSVVESFPLRSKIYVARATDPDALPAAPLRYSLAQNSHDLFDINGHSGEVYLVKRLDYEVQKRHQLVISASDGAGLSTNFSLTVKVQDVNDNPPVFERREYRVDVSETAKVNSQVGISLALLIFACS